MAATAWDIEAGVAKEIIAADEYRDEMVIQLHEQVVHGTDPVFLAFGEAATVETGILLGGIGHSVRVLGAKSRLAVNAISAAVSSGGIETHTSLEYRHILNNPIWQLEQGGLDHPVAIHYWPTPIHGEKVWDYTALDVNPIGIVFDMNVQAGTGNLYLFDSDDNLIEVIPIGDATIDGSIVTFTLTTSPLTEDTAYYVQVEIGAIESLDGIPWLGIDDETTWTFATAPGL